MPDPSKLRAPSQESLFLDTVQRLDRYRAGRKALHFHLSALSRAYNKGQYLQIASESLAVYVSGLEGQFFVFDNGDLIFVSKDATSAVLENAVERVQHLFSQDPLVEQKMSLGKSAFCTWYDFETDYDDLLALAKELVQKIEAKRTMDIYTSAEMHKALAPIEPIMLSRIDQALDTIDVTNISRRQTVATLINESDPQALFEEIYISIEDLQQSIMPGINLASDLWLFRYLTQKLDKRIMSMLIRDGISTSRPFSVNLNIPTILTNDFKRFKDIITPQLKGRLVVELNALDVFSDMNAFMFARDYLHDHGFRICLDGLTHHTLPYYNRSQLGFDLVKLFWTPGALDTMMPSQIPEIRNIVMDCGQAHTILCRCDDALAIQVGQDLGIVMFQGRYIDKLLAASRTAPPPPPPPPKMYRI